MWPNSGMHAAAMATTRSLSLHGLPSPTADTLSSSSFHLRPPAPIPSWGALVVRAVSLAKPGCKPKNSDDTKESSRRRMLLAAGAAMFLSWSNPAASEAKKGFLPVTDKKDGYSFLYPFGWQEVVVQGQDKVYKDVIEPLESVSVNTIPTNKQDIRELGPPDQVAEALIRKVLAAPTQKTKLIEAKESDVDGRTYYTFEFTAQAPNFTRHALGAIAVANGKFYTLTTGANERRWEKMKDRLHTVVDSFKIEARV
uniref:PsbP C-terminal domain-containing protein n=1 Tax=Leersia perrieri TaxID=77586 RepID=A0A0D9VVR0_9ORYZ